MASRYEDSSNQGYTSNLTEQSTTEGSSSQSGSSSTRNSETTTYDLDYMSAVGRQALDSLIAQLMAGGTPAQKQIQQDILRTIQEVDAQRLEYSKSAAFADAEGAMQKALNDALEANMPSILLAGEAAGTSGDAISALLSQDLATRAAGESAQVGINAAVDYGNISAGLLDTRAGLAQREDPVLKALTDALAINKGSVQTGTSKTKGKSTTRSSQSSKSNQTTVRDATEVRQPLAEEDSSSAFSFYAGPKYTSYYN